MNRVVFHRDLASLSILIFLLSLALPVERVEPDGQNPLAAAGDAYGLQLFLSSFAGLLFVGLLWEKPGLYLWIVSGAAANILLMSGWVAARRGARTPLRVCFAISGLALALLCLIRLPTREVAIGYWAWVASMGVLVAAALRRKGPARPPSARQRALAVVVAMSSLCATGCIDGFRMNAIFPLREKRADTNTPAPGSVFVEKVPTPSAVIR